VEYGRDFQTAVLRTVEVAGLDADYDYREAAPKPEKQVAEKTKEKAGEVANAPATMVRAENIHVTGSVGMINHSVSPAYRVFASNLDLSVKNFSNQFSHGPATARMTGRFMGSGETVVAATFRPEDKGPDFDLDVRIDDTDMTTMNDLLRAYGKFDVVRGLFSFYTELKVKNQTVNGYIKPLFRDLKAYDRRQDTEKSVFRKLYEKMVGGVSKVLENWTPRREVATKTTVERSLGGGTNVSTGEALVNLVRNAFFRAILPGFDAELRGSGDGDGRRRAGGEHPAHARGAAKRVSVAQEACPRPTRAVLSRSWTNCGRSSARPRLAEIGVCLPSRPCRLLPTRAPLRTPMQLASHRLNRLTPTALTRTRPTQG
jgi:Domain of Unknown Function (DUF748)